MTKQFTTTIQPTIEMIMSDATRARLHRPAYCVMEDDAVHQVEDAAPVPVPAAEVPVAEAEDAVLVAEPVPVPVPQVEDEEESQLPPIAVKDMDVLIVQDLSTSMENQRYSVAAGINEIFGDVQKRYRKPCEHKGTMCIMRFSSHDRIEVGPVIPVSEVKPVTMRELKCDGMTALWDAAAMAIEHMNTHSAGVPATTYMFTDGDNNDSRIHTQSSVNEMIADNKKRNPMHSVLFIGSDPTTKRNAENIGLDRVHSIQHDSANTPMAYEVCRRALGRCVSGDTQSTEFNNDDIVLSETPSGQNCSTPRGHSPCVVGYTDSQCDDYAFASDDVPSAMPRRAMSSR
jgi:hypothetical protein